MWKSIFIPLIIFQGIGILFFILVCIGLQCVPSGNEFNNTQNDSSIDLNKAQNIDLEKCLKMFEEILAIQQSRDVLGVAMGKSADDFSAGKIGKNKYREIRFDWLTKETKLASDVNKLYTVAYSKNCFDKVEQTL